MQNKTKYFSFLDNPNQIQPNGTGVNWELLINSLEIWNFLQYSSTITLTSHKHTKLHISDLNTQIRYRDSVMKINDQVLNGNYLTKRLKVNLSLRWRASCSVPRKPKHCDQFCIVATRVLSMLNMSLHFTWEGQRIPSYSEKMS